MYDTFIVNIYLETIRLYNKKRLEIKNVFSDNW